MEKFKGAKRRERERWKDSKVQRERQRKMERLRGAKRERERDGKIQGTHRETKKDKLIKRTKKR